MYCVKCGVELAESERKCPLCSTPVYFPDLDPDPERPFPDTPPAHERVNPRGILFIISFVALITALISVFADINTSGTFSRSGYVVGGVILAYVVFILPSWFVKPSPAIFAPVDFAVTALYVWYIAYATGGDWFVTFALPVIGGAALIMCSLVILCYYIRRGYLFIFGGATIATGLFTCLIELLVNLEFEPNLGFLWSPYPAITLTLLGMMLIVIAIVKPFRESLARIFNI